MLVQHHPLWNRVAKLTRQPVAIAMQYLDEVRDGEIGLRVLAHEGIHVPVAGWAPGHYLLSCHGIELADRALGHALGRNELVILLRPAAITGAARRFRLDTGCAQEIDRMANDVPVTDHIAAVPEHYPLGAHDVLRNVGSIGSAHPHAASMRNGGRGSPSRRRPERVILPF